MTMRVPRIPTVLKPLRAISAATAGMPFSIGNGEIASSSRMQK